jgi:DNA-binding response OmpR family regulator
VSIRYVRILIVEDSHDRPGLANSLEIEGYARRSHDGTKGLARASSTEPSLRSRSLRCRPMAIVLLRCGRGGERRARAHSHGREEADKVRGFRYGADDYVTKPFGLLGTARPSQCIAATAGAPARATGNGQSLAIASLRRDR